MTLAKPADLAELEAKVKHMYTAVAKDPGGEFHFEMGPRAGRASRLSDPGAQPDPGRGSLVIRRGRILFRSG